MNNGLVKKARNLEIEELNNSNLISEDAKEIFKILNEIENFTSVLRKEIMIEFKESNSKVIF
jgi:hypothetical protein